MVTKLVRLRKIKSLLESVLGGYFARQIYREWVREVYLTEYESCWPGLKVGKYQGRLSFNALRLVDFLQRFSFIYERNIIFVVVSLLKPHFDKMKK